MNSLIIFCICLQSCDKVNSHALHGASRSIKRMDTNEAEKRSRVLVKYKDLEEMRARNDDQLRQVGGQFNHNWNDSYYPARPAELEDWSLYEMQTLFDYKSKPNNVKQENLFKLGTVKRKRKVGLVFR